MKAISHTEQVFGVFGDRKRTVIHYEDGTTRTIYPEQGKDDKGTVHLPRTQQEAENRSGLNE